MFFDVYEMCTDSTVLVHADVVIGMKYILILANWKGVRCECAYQLYVDCCLIAE